MYNFMHVCVHVPHGSNYIYSQCPVCMHVHAYAHTNTHAHAHVHTHTHTCTHTYLPRRPALATLVPWETSSGFSRWPASWPLTCSWFAPSLLSALTSCDYWRRPALAVGGSSSAMVIIVEFTCMHACVYVFINFVN